MKRRQRWVAPADDGGVLLDPPLDRVPELLDKNRRILDQSQVVLAGTALRDLRAQRFRPDSHSGAPAVVTGHQPEFFHPGVWIKNFVQHGIARRHG